MTTRLVGYGEGEETGGSMRRIVGSIVVVALGVLGFATVGESQTGVTRAEVGRGTVGASYTIEGGEATDVVVQKVTIEPGATAAWHTHPGSETAIVMAGTLTFFDGYDEKCAQREYKAGEVLVGSGHVHQGKNLGKEPVEIVSTYFNVPSGGKAATPVSRPAHCPE
jgi:quercetin dioxygenase-like cupin family protein